MRLVRGTIPGFTGERDIAVIEGDANLGTWTEQNRRLDNERGLLDKLAGLGYFAPGSVLYDLGANIGDHTAYFASRRPRSVVAWEAYPDAYECLCFNLAPYREWTKLELIDRPVGNGEPVELGTSINIACENKGARTIRAAATPQAATRSQRIDDLVRAGAIEPPTFMKLDIEGWEVNALTGARATIERHRPAMLCEVGRHLLAAAGNSAEELHALLTSFGYDLRDTSGSTWLPGDQRPGFDILAVPR